MWEKRNITDSLNKNYQTFFTLSSVPLIYSRMIRPNYYAKIDRARYRVQMMHLHHVQCPHQNLHIYIIVDKK